MKLDFNHASITITHDETDLLVFPYEEFDPRGCLEEEHAHVGADVKACLQFTFHVHQCGEPRFIELGCDEKQYHSDRLHP